jgi:hypothetical protein
MQTIINFLPILSFLFGGGALVAIIKLLLKLNNRIKANEKGTQALLRDRLYHIYYKYKDLGYRTSHSTENFENIYTQYHTLGANGVMDDVRKQFYELELEEERFNQDSIKI